MFLVDHMVSLTEAGMRKYLLSLVLTEISMCAAVCHTHKSSCYSSNATDRVCDPDVLFIYFPIYTAPASL